MWVVSEHARRTIYTYTKDMIMNEVTARKLIDICICFAVSEQFFLQPTLYSSAYNQQYIHNLSSLLSLFEFKEITIIWRGIIMYVCGL